MRFLCIICNTCNGFAISKTGIVLHRILARDAADVLYEPEYYGDLLDALCTLCPPGTPFLTCYRQRTNLQEESFGAAAVTAGFEVTQATDAELHEEYRGGGYWLLRIQRRL